MLKVYIMMIIFGFICGLSVCAQAKSEMIVFEEQHLLENPIYGVIIFEEDFVKNLIKVLDDNNYTYTLFSDYIETDIEFFTNDTQSKINVGGSNAGYNYVKLDPNNYEYQNIFLKINRFEEEKDYREFFLNNFNNITMVGFNSYTPPTPQYYSYILYLIIILTILISIILVNTSKDEIYVFKLLSTGKNKIIKYYLLKIVKLVIVALIGSLIPIIYYMNTYYYYFSKVENTVFYVLVYLLLIVVVLFSTFTLQYKFIKVEDLRRGQL